jgi:HAMP domain-containing protein
MSVHLRLRIVLVALIGALLVISLGTALQFREIAISATQMLGPDARLLEAAAQMQRLLGAGERGLAFEESFRAQLEHVDASETTDEERRLAQDVRAAFEQLVARHQAGEQTLADERAVAEAVAVFTAQVGREATESADTVGSQATTAAIGLGVVGLLGLIGGAGALRSIRRGFLERLQELERAALDIQRGDDARRVSTSGEDELARVAQALNSTLDSRDRCAAEMSGRNREMRALLVALLRRSHGAVALTGIDGEVLASTLQASDEDRLRSLTPQLRKAASILLSRGFASAAELATDVSFPDGGVVHIRALALGEQRVVGWLAEFERPKTAHSNSEPSPAASP